MKTIDFKKILLQKNNETFLQYTLRLYLPANIIYAIIMLTYTLALISYSKDSLFYALAIATASSLVFEAIFSPIIHSLMTKKISRMLFYNELGTFDADDKKQLLYEILRYPVYKALETFIHFLLSSLVLSFMIFTILNLDAKVFYSLLVMQVFSAYFISLVNYHSMEVVCSEKAMKLIQDGIDIESIEKNYLGMSQRLLFFVYVLIPLFILGTNIFNVINLGNMELIFHKNGSLIAKSLSRLEQNGAFSFRKIESLDLTIRVIIFAFANIVILTCLVFLYFSRIKKYTEKMQGGLLSINANEIEEAKDLPVDMSSELSYTMFLINKTMHLFSSLMKRTFEINGMIDIACQNLASIAEESKSTAITQSTGAKEIVSTMQFANKQALSIETKIHEVNNVASKTKESVDFGFEAVKQNISKMQEIRASNLTTIEGIEKLSKRIASIWDIVKLIDSVTDQTKIIAFNAELEADSISGPKEKFQNVAYEIRSLTDSVMSLTKQIKEHIQLIQSTSNVLIEAGQECSEKIEDGNNLTLELQKKFNEIKVSATRTSKSASQIIETIKAQREAFSMITDKLQQTSASIENFTSSTQTISSVVHNLQAGSKHLSSLYNK